MTICLLITNTELMASEQPMNIGMIPLGPFDLTPFLNIEERYDDNIFHNDINKKSSLITQIEGGGEVALRRNLDRYALRYGFRSSQYHNSPDDDFVDHRLELNTHFDFNIRNSLDITGGATKAHNMRGTFFSQGDVATQLNEPDRYHSFNAEANYRYGRVDAPGNLRLQMSWDQLTYDNHHDRTAGQDNSQFEITPGFYYRVMPKTYLTTEIQNTFLRYTNASEAQPADPNNGIDYDKHRYLLGLSWEQSVKTQGKVRAGLLQLNYNESNQPSQSFLTWDGQLVWSPITYTHFTLHMERDIQPSLGSGTTRFLQIYDAAWTHDWLSRVSTELTGTYQDVLNQNNVQNQTSSGGLSFKFDIKYKMRSWIDLGINYYYSDFQGTTNDFNSTQNIFMLYMQAMPHAELN